MHEKGGTCIEEWFSPKGPVRFWWTPENVYRESPFEIIDWFTMRKGRRAEPFIRWCRDRYTNADGGSAVLVDAPFVPKREIYTLWAECRSDAAAARWVEVAPPEIAPTPAGSVAVGDEPRFSQIKFRFLLRLHVHRRELHQHIGLNIHWRADSKCVEIGAPIRQRQNRDGDLFAV